MSHSQWIKLYWADWLADANLRRCSLAARGFWMDLLCIAAQSEPQGYVAAGEVPLDNSDISRICGVSLRDVESLIRELQRNRVIARDEFGRIYSPRMVRDADKRMRAKKSGTLGGNPVLLRSADNQLSAQNETVADILEGELLHP